MTKVIIIGGLHHNTLGVIRSLGERGVKKNDIIVLLVGNNFPKLNIISSCRYVDKDNYFCLSNYEEVIPWLTKNRNGGYVTICCSDGSAQYIMSYRKEIEEFCETPSVKIDVQEIMRKDVQLEIAKECGMTTPRSCVQDSKQECDWSVFPCITKPIKSVSGAGKGDIHIAQNPTELKHILSNTKAEQVQIQQYIDKSMEFQLIGCSLDAGERIIIPGFTDIIRQPKNTNTGYLKYSPIRDLDFDLTNTYTFIRKIGYSGLFSVEFVRGKDGNDYFMEINMRNDGNGYCVQSAGVNLPYIWYYYCLKGELPKDEPINFETPVFFIPDLSDLRRGLKSEGFYGWLKQFCSAKSHSVWNKKDMMPFCVAFYQMIKQFINNRIHIF